LGVTGPFHRAHAPPVGHAEALAPGLRVVTAPNAGPMTFTGTRSYIVGERRVAVIDPGPDDAAHVTALLGALGRGERIAAILVTHAHRDHCGAAAALAGATGAPVHGFGERPAPPPLAARLAGAGGAGLDPGFRPDVLLGDGAELAGPDWRLTVLHTPGHLSDHLCFAWAEGGALFSGDLVMGWSTTVIAPPDGALAPFRASLRRLMQRGETIYYPGHGPPVRRPRRLISHLLAHRGMRERQVLAALSRPARVGDLVASIYAEADPALRGAAARTLLAHLIDLVERGLVTVEGPPGLRAVYRRAER
jgi:glyoxylase-like metal-dependent hydrolase (beta-lactamase superfamily II)